MFKFLFLMLILLAGFIGGPYLAGKQGYVLIETTDYQIELSITTLVIFFVVSLAIVYFVEWIMSKLFHLSTGSYHWFGRRKKLKAQQQTLDGLMLLEKGEYQKAQKLIGKNAKHSEQPILNLIKAAEAAQKAGNSFDANNYLLQATDLTGENDLLVEITRTKIFVAQNKLSEAEESIDKLLVSHYKNKAILKLAVKIYLKTHQYEKLDHILDQIEKSELYNSAEFDDLEEQIENGLMQGKESSSLISWWEKQSNKRRKQFNTKLNLVKHLLNNNDQDVAYQHLLDLIKKIDSSHFDLLPKLHQEIIRLKIKDSTKLQNLLEKLSSKAVDHRTELYRALGHLYVHMKNFKKAGQAFEIVLADKQHIQPQDIAMASYVFEQNGNIEKSQQIRESYLLNQPKKDIISVDQKEA